MISSVYGKSTEEFSFMETLCESLNKNWNELQPWIVFLALNYFFILNNLTFVYWTQIWKIRKKCKNKSMLDGMEWKNLQFKSQFPEITLFFLDAGIFQNTLHSLQVIEIYYNYGFCGGFSNLYRNLTTLWCFCVFFIFKYF